MTWIKGANGRSLNLIDDDKQWCGRVDHLADTSGQLISKFSALYPKMRLEVYDRVEDAVKAVVDKHTPDLNIDSAVIDDMFSRTGDAPPATPETPEGDN